MKYVSDHLLNQTGGSDIPLYILEDPETKPSSHGMNCSKYTSDNNNMNQLFAYISNTNGYCSRHVKITFDQD